ncbi:MAG: alpha/beta hydrolase [Chloroflexi bacterium]|nr:alpha/beta hydrolase [Chloroflexota bacterium]
MPKVTINGVGINYESNGEGFPLVLCYCRGGNATMWTPQVEAFSENYRFIRFEPRGHGKSDSPEDPSAYGLDVSVEDLLGLFGHLGIEKAYVGGLSMGGGITTRFTLLHPDRVAGLMVIDSGSASGHAHSEEIRENTARVRELAFTEGMEAVARHSVREVDSFALRAARGPEEAEGMVEMIKALTPHGYVYSLEALDQAPAFDDRLCEITAPTLCIAGENDPALEDVKFIHSQIEGSELVVVPDAGHFTNLDQTEVFNGEVLAFLAKVDARRAAAVA